MRRRYDLNNQQWDKIEHLLGREDKGFGRSRRDDHTFLNGVFWMLNSVASWQDCLRVSTLGKRFTIDFATGKSKA
jgi:transposase